MPQRVLLLPREHAHLADQARHVAGKDVSDEPPARVGQRHRLVAPIVLASGPLHEPAAQQIAHDDGGVGVAAEQLLSELALTQRPVVQQRLQRAELADGEAGPRHDAADPRGQRLRRAHELDVRVQRGGFGGAPGVAGRHGSNSKCL